MGFLARLTFRSLYLLGQGRQFPVFLCLLPITQGSSFHRLSRTPRGFSMQMLFYSYILLFTPRCVRPLHLVLYEHCCRTPPLGLSLARLYYLLASASAHSFPINSPSGHKGNLQQAAATNKKNYKWEVRGSLETRLNPEAGPPPKTLGISCLQCPATTHGD